MAVLHIFIICTKASLPYWHAPIKTCYGTITSKVLAYYCANNRRVSLGIHTKNNTNIVQEDDRELQEKPEPTIFIELVVHGGRISIVDVAGKESGEAADDQQW